MGHFGEVWDALAKFGKLLTDFWKEVWRTGQSAAFTRTLMDCRPDGRRRAVFGRRSRPKTKRPPVETEGRLTIACHMKRDNDLVVREHKIKRLIQNPKSLRLSNS